MTRAEASKLVRSLFLSWYSSAVRYACRVSGSLEMAEDLVQEGFQALYLELISGEEVVDPKRWTFCVIRRNAGKLRRSQKSHGEELMPNADFEVVPDTQMLGPEEAFECGELYEMMGKLSSREEEVLLLRVNGLRYREIAEDLSISQNSVKTLLARALKKLRAPGRKTGARTEVSLHEASGNSKTLH